MPLRHKGIKFCDFLVPWWLKIWVMKWKIRADFTILGQFSTITRLISVRLRTFLNAVSY